MDLDIFKLDDEDLPTIEHETVEMSIEEYIYKTRLFFNELMDL